ncbi:phytoene desaturase family protein [Gynurincola endophyticus]|uniref:phytoene desaturase family protein n=1 Tax=Gynurincola endophyticus TaxID=2479004 RepID=UPI0018F6C95D|nr:phytoene desaturase family protein [Gynurincola endophyticus]
MARIIVIGSGISGMVAACYLKKAGHQVTVLEKNSSAGGRARKFEDKGFTFDMGPSWYWMPEVFESFFHDFGYNSGDFYELKRLSPSYSVVFEDRKIDIPASTKELADLFEEIEPGSAAKLTAYLEDASVKYKLGMNDFAKKPALSITEFINKDALSVVNKLQPFRNMEQHVNKYFQNPVIRKIMQFPVIFLGAMPDRIPAMYSLMNYADSCLGTWYPIGGMFKIVDAIHKIATGIGVEFKFNENVEELVINKGKVCAVKTSGNRFDGDTVIASGDYHHIEQLLPVKYRQYDEKYWSKKEMAPSCLLFFVGVDKKLPVHHHTLFFDTGFDQHARSLYKNPEWPQNPLFYVCAPSVTDNTVAPEGKENLFILIPVAAGLDGDTETRRNDYFNQVIRRLEEQLQTDVAPHIIYKKSYGIKDFSTDYHAYRGNAYGMANTLMQTAFGKPRLNSRKVENLFFCGQLTVPGPGVPPAFLSGNMAAEAAAKYLTKKLIHA